MIRLIRHLVHWKDSLWSQKSESIRDFWFSLFAKINIQRYKISDLHDDVWFSHVTFRFSFKCSTPACSSKSKHLHSMDPNDSARGNDGEHSSACHRSDWCFNDLQPFISKHRIIWRGCRRLPACSLLPGVPSVPPRASCLPTFIQFFFPKIFFRLSSCPPSSISHLILPEAVLAFKAWSRLFLLLMTYLINSPANLFSSYVIVLNYQVTSEGGPQ